MFKKLKENNKKGFTLVELIVVLVILAILAALLIPALTGYIDKAKNKSIVAETRQTVMAAQTLVDEAYAKADVGADTVKVEGQTGAGNDAITKQAIADLAEVSKDNIISVTVTNGKVAELKYKKSGKTCTYTAGKTDGTDGAYDVEKSGTTSQS